MAQLSTELRQLDQALPSSPEAERAILGAILLDGELIHQAARLLRPDDFYTEPYKYVFLIMVGLMEKGKTMDQILIWEEAKRGKHMTEVLTLGYITNLTYGLPHSTNISYYANIIRQHSKSRWLLRFAARIHATILDGQTPPDDVAKWIIEEVDQADTALENLRRPMSIDQMYEDQALRFNLFHKGISDAIPTGFPEIDEKLLGGGLLPSLMYVLAGRPSMGKTTLAIDIICNAADAGRRCMIVSRETPKEMLVDRMVSAKSGVERFKISSGMTKTNYDRAMETLQAMRLAPIVIDDFSTTIHEVDRWLAEYERKGQRIELLMMDYLQLMSGQGDSRVQEVSGISKGFKGLLTKYKIPGIPVSQLSRAPGDSEPELHHLRESGQIEQDADCVMFVHGDQTEEDLEYLLKELICKKQRDGPHFRRSMSMSTGLVTFRRPSMLGLSEPIQPRRMGTDEEELARQKARGKGADTNETPEFKF